MCCLSGVLMTMARAVVDCQMMHRDTNPESTHKANLAPRGHLDATNNPDIARDWWATDPDAGIGISLAQSGLVALDIDPRNGGDETLAKIESQHGVLYSDCVAVTQSGGEHRLFRAEENTSIQVA